MRSTQEAIRQYKHICWYPSAGNDFRVLLYLSDWYYKKHNLYQNGKQVTPDLFIMSDVKGLCAFSDGTSYFENTYKQVRNGTCKPGACLISLPSKKSSTEIFLKCFEKLCDLPLSFNQELTVGDRVPEYASSFLMEVEIVSRIDEEINRYDASVLYVTAQNECFAKEFLIPNRIKVEYQVLIRYGEGFGGANEKPTWIIQAYRDLGIKNLIANDRYIEWAKAESTEKPCPEFEELYTIDGCQWSSYGPVIWAKLD